MSATERSIFELIFKQSLAPSIILQANAPEFSVVALNREYMAVHMVKLSGISKPRSIEII